MNLRNKIWKKREDLLEGWQKKDFSICWSIDFVPKCTYFHVRYSEANLLASMFMMNYVKALHPKAWNTVHLTNLWIKFHKSTSLYKSFGLKQVARCVYITIGKNFVNNTNLVVIGIKACHQLLGNLGTTK